MTVDIFSTDNKYSVIYADPPWKYNTYSPNGSTAEKHYNCMTPDEIDVLPIGQIAAKDCVLFLWVTFPCLIQGIRTIDRWGFKYKTCAFTWVKRCKKSPGFFMGNGYWTRSNAEICLLAVKGNPKRVSKSVRQICDSRISKHSEKPFEIRDRIVELCGDVPRIELFARTTADGWDCWGDEV